LALASLYVIAFGFYPIAAGFYLIAAGFYPIADGFYPIADGLNPIPGCFYPHRRSFSRDRTAGRDADFPAGADARRSDRR